MSTCGPGSRTRSRFCSSGIDADCVGGAIEASDCNDQDCLRTLIMIYHNAKLASASTSLRDQFVDTRAKLYQ